MWNAVNAFDSMGMSYTYNKETENVCKKCEVMWLKVTLDRIFLTYFETHIGYNARIAPAVTFKICSKISASTTPKI